MSETIDPIASPEAYRASILAALGDDDPVIAQGETVARMHALVADAGEWLRVRPAPGEWSAIECIGHIVDSELVMSARSRWILAEEQPELVGYDQDLWVARLEHNDDDPAVLIGMFEAVRRSNLDLWARRPTEDHDRVGRHRERGPESYELTFRLSAGHDRVHLGQARRTLDELVGDAGRRPDRQSRPTR
jgi:DinB superfamily